MKQIRLTNSEISDITTQLGTLIHGGINVGDGLSYMADNEEDHDMKEMLDTMVKDADDGLGLSSIFKKAGCFPDYATGLLEISEKTGGTEDALMALGRYYDGRARLERHLKSAILYPAVLLMVMLVIVVVLLVKVIPIFNDVYAQLGSSLTGVAGGLMSLGAFLDKIMPLLLIILVIAVVLIVMFAGSSPFRDRLMSWWAAKRGSKGVFCQIAKARFAQALAMGMTTGLTTSETFDLAKKIMSDSPYVSGLVDKARDAVDDGETMTKALESSGLLAKAQCRMIEVGLKAGRGDQVITDVADRMMEESDVALEERVEKVEPALVVATSIIVGLILLSVMLPLVNIMGAIG